MLVREGTKKLTNVSVITLKKFNKRFELAVYPNKLFEYRSNPDIALSTILHTPQIYRSAATGDVVSDSDLSLFGVPREEIIRQILDSGHEQKASATSRYELSAIERQILDMVQHKVTYQGSYVSRDVLHSFVRRVWDVKNEGAKKQVSRIIRELEKIGFERISYMVRCGAVEYEGAERVDGGVIVKSDVLPGFIEYCESNSIKYIIMKNEEVESEEIC